MSPGAFGAALRFLTTLPLPGPTAVSAGSVAFFPLAGALIGALVAIADQAVGRLLPAPVVIALDLVLLAALSGGLHLDGLADAVDGLFGGADREARLAIMRAGTIGAFGAAAIVLALLVEYASLGSIAARGSALVAAATCSRWAMAVAVVAFPYARTEGLGVAFRRGLGRRHLALASALAAVVVGLTLGAEGVWLLALAASLAVAIGGFARRAFGGLTGDVYGAIGEIVFAASLAARTASVS